MSNAKRRWIFVTFLATAALPATAAAEEARADEGGSSSSAAAPPEKREGAHTEEERSEAFRIGAIAGVGFPRPLAVEGLVKVDRVIGAGLELGFLPATEIAGVRARMTSIAADLRVFPFRGAFFVGLRAGHQELSAETTLSYSGFSVTETATATTWFVNPRVGFLFTWESGFSLGIDAGVQLPIGAQLDTSLPSGVPGGVDRSIATVAGAFGNNVTPTVDLLRIGFLF